MSRRRASWLWDRTTGSPADSRATLPPSTVSPQPGDLAVTGATGWRDNTASRIHATATAAQCSSSCATAIDRRRMPSRICSGWALEKFSRMCEPLSPDGNRVHGGDSRRQRDPEEQSALGMRPTHVRREVVVQGLKHGIATFFVHPANQLYVLFHEAIASHLVGHHLREAAGV